MTPTLKIIKNFVKILLDEVACFSISRFNECNNVRIFRSRVRVQRWRRKIFELQGVIILKISSNHPNQIAKHQTL